MKLEIIQDTDPLNPRQEFDQIGTMVTWHRDYILGDDQSKESRESWVCSLAQVIMHEMGRKCKYFDSDEQTDLDNAVAIVKKHAVILPLYLYDHGGLSISTGAFSDPFDSDLLGYIYATRTTVAREWGDWSDFTRERAKECLRLEVVEYDQYLTGDVYGYRILDDNGDSLDSCWGFYGYDNCKEQGQEAMKVFEDQEQKALEALAYVA